MSVGTFTTKNGHTVMFDEADRVIATQRRYYGATLAGRVYPRRSLTVDGRDVSRTLGQDILLPRPGVNVVYRDGNPLNCTRANLALATVAQRTATQRRTNRSGYRGVYPHGRNFHAQGWNGQSVYLGSFATAVEAAVAYDAWAGATFGAHATLNFPHADPFLVTGRLRKALDKADAE